SNSTIWGSDAVGGVIEITTRREAGLGGAVEYGARDTLFASAVGGFESERGFASLSGSYHRTDGFSAAARGMEEDGFEQRAFAGSAFFDVTPEIELFAHGRFADGELDIDSFSFDPPFLPVDSAEVQETRQFSGAVGAAYYGLDLTLRGFYSLADTERDNYAGPDASEPLFASDGKSQRAVLRGEYRLIGGLSLAFGGEHERTEYETSFADPAKVNITGAYGQLGWVLGRLAIHAGARVDDHELFGSEWSFGGDVSYGLGQDWRLKASVGEGFKAPTLFQLFSDFGNRELAPERSTSFDIGIERGLRGGPFHAALTLFRRDSENLIDFAFTGEAPGGTYFNIGEARAQGIELELAARPVNALSVAAVYALVDTEDRTASALTLGNELARRPRHALTVYADWLTPLAGLILGGDLRLVGDSFDDAANARPLEGYALLDLRASMPLGERLELFGRVENVFDAEYQTVLGYGQAGRGAFAGIRLAL
ncbi:MAG: TonB-dependent receptor, partial [Erythrobacter sp.]|nr:TonB-dependent receptor [Erythrobacter sp.]